MDIPSNSLYVDTMLGPLPQENRQTCLEAMDKYGDNRWWLSNDPKERAYHQIKEPVLLYKSFEDFHADLSVLLNRSVFTHEVTSNNFKLEVERAWKYNVGCTSDKERLERFAESLQELEDRGIDAQIIPLSNCN